MAQDVHEDWADIILVVLSFISGMVDSAVFNTWSCFVSMQTGTFLTIGFRSELRHVFFFLQSAAVIFDSEAARIRTDWQYGLGNTVYVGLGVSGQPHSQPFRWVKSSTAIASFCLGCFFFSRASRFLGPLKRGTMVSSCLFQATLCFAAVVMVVTGFVPKDAGDRLPHNFIVLLPLSLLSFQSAGQIVMSRFLGYVRSFSSLLHPWRLL